MRAKIQGELCTTCGIYSIINALQLLLKREFNVKETQELYKKCIEAVDDHKELLKNGLTQYEMEDILNEVVPFVRKKYKTSLVFDFPHRKTKIKKVSDFTDQTKYMTKNGSVFIIGFHKPYPHWTVTDKVTKYNMYLFDSNCGRYKIGIDRIFLKKKDFQEGRCVLDAPCTIRLTV